MVLENEYRNECRHPWPVGYSCPSCGINVCVFCAANQEECYCDAMVPKGIFAKWPHNLTFNVEDVD
jgi:hypothetical protein